MLEFISIKDNETGRVLQISRQTEPYRCPYTVVLDGLEVKEVRKGLIGKVIRTWMKERKLDNDR